MKLFRTIFSLAPALALVSCVANDEQSRTSEKTAQLVYSVEEVTVRTMESLPEQLQITARGTARTGGWSAPHLRLRPGAAKNGVYEFDFVAVPPDGMATQALTPIETMTTLPKKPKDFRSARVFAETNQQQSR